jgi:ABC-type uncharacterized transport system auxiliary subunit
MNTLHRIGIAALAALLTTACSGVLTSDLPPRQEYLLNPVEMAGSAGAEPAPELSIRVRVVPGLDTNRILALGEDQRLSQYANAHWPDNLPEVMASVLERSFRSSNRFASVEAAPNPAPGDWVIEVQLQAFYGLQDAGGQTSDVEAAMAGSVQCGDRDGQFELSATAPVDEQRLGAVVAAHQRALNRLTFELGEEIDKTCG